MVNLFRLVPVYTCIKKNCSHFEILVGRYIINIVALIVYRQFLNKVPYLTHIYYTLTFKDCEPLRLAIATLVQSYRRIILPCYPVTRNTKITNKSILN